MGGLDSGSDEDNDDDNSWWIYGWLKVDSIDHFGRTLYF